jgi:chromosome segregation ATPase
VLGRVCKKYEVPERVMFALQELAADRQGEIVRLESELDENTMELEVLTEQLKAMTDAHLSNKTKISELESTKHELLRDLSSLKMHQQEEINLRHQLADSKREIQQLNVKIQGLEGEVQDLQTAKVQALNVCARCPANADVHTNIFHLANPILTEVSTLCSPDLVANRP